MKLFEKNVGGLDRVLRVLFGLGFLYYSFAGLAAPLIYIGIILGAILLFTGLMGTCTLYSLFGISTVGKPCCGLPRK
ncbi:MAG TPA: DUF2892 domain-containing protein [Candidatus Bilamarchaeaceae archaeon]|nr:DUF2892 domain-containing protein [Candidatus Bilamarchaeaceae archaeon]